MSDTKVLLKGIIDFGALSQESLAGNYQRLRSSKVEWTNPVDEKVYKFVSSFFEQELDIPSSKILTDYFERLEDYETQERLKEISDATSYEGSNYSFVLKGLLEDQNRFNLLTALKETQEVAQKGLVVGEGRDKTRIHGVKDAILYFQRQVSDLIISDYNARTRGDIRKATKEAWEAYQYAKANPGQAWGAFLGIDHVDKVCRGIKRGELWIHAAFTGELKTALAMNTAYNLVTRYRRNVFYVSLEMPFEQMRNIICTLHSAHPSFKAQGYQPLDYRSIRDGLLTAEEETFYKKVLKDFETNPEYCRLELWCPDHDVTVSDVKMEAELLHKQMEIGLLCIDHGGLVQPLRYNRDFVISLNSVIRDSKKLALHFNQGAGVPVMLLFQINRLGKAEADKNEGRYKLSALSYANEAEKSADVVTTTYLNDDLRQDGRSIMCCLKNRDNPTFSPFQLGVDFSCRRIYQAEVGEDLVSDDDAMEGMLEV